MYSGAVLFNLNKEFDKYIINDIDRNIIRIYKTFKNISYNTYKTTVDSIFKEFGEFTLLDERTFENIQRILKRTEIHNTSYKDLLKEDAFFSSTLLMHRKQVHILPDFLSKTKKNFLELIKDKEYLYADILNNVNEHLENKIILREMASTAPSTNKGKNSNIECLFSSYSLDNDW